MLIDPSTSPGKPQTERMLLIHGALRREFALLPRIVRSVEASDVRRARAVVRHIHLLLALLDGHDEDVTLWPILHQRAWMNAGPLDALERRQRKIVNCIAWIEKSAECWQVDGDVPVRNGLAVDLQDTLALLTEHLDLKERDVLPLIYEHLSVAEWRTLQRDNRDRFPTGFRDRMILAGLALEDASDSEATRFVSDLPPLDRPLWRLIGSRMYVRYIAEIRGLVLSRG